MSRSTRRATSACAPTATAAAPLPGPTMTPIPNGGPDPDVLDEVCLRGELTVIGRIRSANNATFLCEAHLGERQAHCVYKPIAGERPLWDFPHGTLAGREVAAYVVSRAGGWNFVPPSVMRDGPFGPGMCQLWIDLDETIDLIGLARSTDHQSLREMAVFDAVINNADRKIGH